MVQAPPIERGLVLEYLTLGWNVIVLVIVVAAYTARSVALAGFGLDSLIGIFASFIVVCQLLGVKRRPKSWHSASSGQLSLPLPSTFWHRLQ